MPWTSVLTGDFVQDCAGGAGEEVLQCFTIQMGSERVYITFHRAAMGVSFEKSIQGKRLNSEKSNSELQCASPFISIPFAHVIFFKD